jgi:hypothetical protein
MKYTEIDKYNYNEANNYWNWLLRHSFNKEQEKELEILSTLLNDYEINSLYEKED